MADPITMINGTGIVADASVLLFQRFEWLYGALKGLGVLLVIYFIYLGFNAFTQQKMKRRVKNIEKKLISIERKIDILIGADLKKKRSIKKVTKRG